MCNQSNLVLNPKNQLQCICPFGTYGLNCQQYLVCSNDSNIICNLTRYTQCNESEIVYYETCYCCNDSKFLIGI